MYIFITYVSTCENVQHSTQTRSAGLEVVTNMRENEEKNLNFRILQLIEFEKLF